MNVLLYAKMHAKNNCNFSTEQKSVLHSINALAVEIYAELIVHYIVCIHKLFANYSSFIFLY